MNPPDSNCKTIEGMKKLPLNLVPPIGMLWEGAVFRYSQDRGRAPLNWRTEPISASIYYSAIQRHLLAWQDGQDDDESSQLSHLAHAKANLSIMLDAMACGTFNDDRPHSGQSPSFLAAQERFEHEKPPPEPEDCWP